MPKSISYLIYWMCAPIAKSSDLEKLKGPQRGLRASQTTSNASVTTRYALKPLGACDIGITMCSVPALTTSYSGLNFKVLFRTLRFTR